jgi:hypothetical protein
MAHCCRANAHYPATCNFSHGFMAVSNKARSTLTIGHAAAAFDNPINGPRYDNERDKSRERERDREGGIVAAYR